jgi:hypothetical protein
MSLTLFGFRERPHDFAATKTGATLEECTFLLDFKRPLERIRWFVVRNRWVGITVGLHVPVVHLGEIDGGYVIRLKRGEPYFEAIPMLWNRHYGTARTTRSETVGPLEIVADFGRHFTEDC